jgi:protein-tyrosine phosphatase
VVRRILTVCLGNHCRSPLAAAVLAHHGGSAVEVRSAGIRDKWIGRPAHPAMIAAAAERGYDLTRHRGAQITPALMRWADLILAMDTANLTTLRGVVHQCDATKLTLYLGDRDVPDPWDRPVEEFTACVRIIETAALRHFP